MVDVHSACGYSSTSYLQSCASPVTTRTRKGLFLSFPMDPGFVTVLFSLQDKCFENWPQLKSVLKVLKMMEVLCQRSCVTGPRRAEKQYLWVSGWPNIIISAVLRNGIPLSDKGTHETD